MKTPNEWMMDAINGDCVDEGVEKSNCATCLEEMFAAAIADARRDALEEAAKVAEAAARGWEASASGWTAKGRHDLFSDDMRSADQARLIAESIRALATKDGAR